MPRSPSTRRSSGRERPGSKYLFLVFDRRLVLDAKPSIELDHAHPARFQWPEANHLASTTSVAGQVAMVTMTLQETINLDCLQQFWASKLHTPFQGIMRHHNFQQKDGAWAKRSEDSVQTLVHAGRTRWSESGGRCPSRSCCVTNPHYLHGQPDKDPFGGQGRFRSNNLSFSHVIKLHPSLGREAKSHGGQLQQQQ